MISNAKGRHVSPGVYTEEKDATFSVKTLGITSLGLVGETLYGPAFENIEISEWNDFVDYFGGTSVETYKGTGLPKYELPYIAKSYLTKSKRLNVVRVLGFSGYHAKRVWVVKSETDPPRPVVIIRSKQYKESSSDDPCNPNESWAEFVKAVTIGRYNGSVYNTYCGERESLRAAEYYLNDSKKFSIKVDTIGDNSEYYNVSLDPRDSDYIYNVISSNPQDTKKSSIYIEEVFEDALDDGQNVKYEDIEPLESPYYDDYLAKYRCALTPWIVSEATRFYRDSEDTCGAISLKRLFRFVTISDGDASNYQVKISLEKINPFDGTFDVVVRDFNDEDSNIVVLEKFSKCTLKKGDSSFIGYKIGTNDGLYSNNSKYITVELASNEDFGNSIPCGFLGFPTPSYNGLSLDKMITYNTEYKPKIKERKQYFGISKVDTDILSFKGRQYYKEDDMTPCIDSHGNVVYAEDLACTNGFHMDSVFLDQCGLEIYLDGELSNYVFDCVSNKKVSSDIFSPILTNSTVSGTNLQPDTKYINETIYKNEKLRKFTVCFYGGFDGWDINRDSRSNTDEFNVNKYGVRNGGYYTFDEAVEYHLPSYVNRSDYYAYLAGYEIFSNPQDVDINVLATPGIDWYNNTLLTKDVIELVEDPEDGRGGDTLYVMNSPYGMTDINELTESFEESEINSSYVCTYAPWILYKDTVRNEFLYLPPTKDVVRNIADTDNTSFPWFAPAGTTRGLVVCEKAEYKTTLDDEDKLYEGRINPIKTFGKDGVIVWGNKTAYTVDSPLNRINVRRLMIRVKKLISSAAKHLIFEQYDDAVEKQFRGLVEPILADVKSNRGIFDYRVITEVTPETRDQHILPAKILIKPTPALEYISITFVVYPESVAFEE